MASGHSGLSGLEIITPITSALAFLPCAGLDGFVAAGEENLYDPTIEAMHLLPRRFDMRTPYSSSQGRLREQQHSSSQLLFGYFRKACRTSSRGRLFREGRRYHAAACFTSLCRTQKNEAVESLGSRSLGS